MGCKRRRNQRASSKESPPTPSGNPVPATISIGEYYWGYASGVIATKVPDWGEFVLAELTLPFDQPDVAYFHPLMADTERRLGFRPRFGALDAVYDAFYVYEYFYRDDWPLDQAFAAVPLSKRGGKHRQLDHLGLPLCDAGLAMPLKRTFICKTTRIEHERGRFACPLVYPEPTGESCPIQHKNWPKGCITTMATSVGARIQRRRFAGLRADGSIRGGMPCGWLNRSLLPRSGCLLWVSCATRPSFRAPGKAIWSPGYLFDPFRFTTCYTILDMSAAVYAQVGSANANTTYGAVLENHEILGGSYNRQTMVDVADGDLGTGMHLYREDGMTLPGDLPPLQPGYVPQPDGEKKWIPAKVD